LVYGRREMKGSLRPCCWPGREPIDRTPCPAPIATVLAYEFQKLVSWSRMAALTNSRRREPALHHDHDREPQSHPGLSAGSQWAHVARWRGPGKPGNRRTSISTLEAVTSSRGRSSRGPAHPHGCGDNMKRSGGEGLFGVGSQVWPWRI